MARPRTLTAQLRHFVDGPTGGVVPPIQPTTTFVRDPGYRLAAGREYARDDGPVQEVAEDVLAALEGGVECLLFASGMAAATTLVRAAVEPGRQLVASRAMYHGLRTWLTGYCPRNGLTLTLVDATRVSEVESALSPSTALVWMETPANPTWDVVDLEAVAAVCRKAGVPLAVDSTVPTPVHTRPLELGASYVMHSATKFLNGHSDVLAGALVAAEDDAVWQRVKLARRQEGNLLGPFEAYLLARGMRTLHVRMERSSASAATLATRLAAHPEVEQVLYPGLSTHPGHAIAARQMRDGFGAMLSLIVPGGAARALEVAGRVEVFLRATSLGGTESLLEHRASVEGPMSLAPAGLLRLSVGLEDVEDLWADLERALG